MNACFGEMLERDSGAAQKVYNMARESKKDKTPTGTVESPICNQGRGALAPISVYHSCMHLARSCLRYDICDHAPLRTLTVIICTSIILVAFNRYEMALRRLIFMTNNSPVNRISKLWPTPRCPIE